MIEDVKAILEAGQLTADVTDRIANVAHPADTELTVPVALITHSNGGSGVALAKEILEALDSRRAGPLRRAGVTRLSEVDSFVEFLKRWGSPTSSVVYADASRLELHAVLDDHPASPDGTAWRQHRAVYSCPRAAEWLAWTGAADKPMRQATFGDWIEARLEDLVKAEGFPAPAEMLTTARKLTVLTKGTFQRDINPVTGDSVLINKLETQTGSTPIPRAFAIAIPCFEGGDRYQLEARLRFSLVDGVPLFEYTLHRAKEIERDAFGEVRVKVAKESGLPVLAGTP